MTPTTTTAKFRVAFLSLPDLISDNEAYGTNELREITRLFSVFVISFERLEAIPCVNRGPMIGDGRSRSRSSSPDGLFLGTTFDPSSAPTRLQRRSQTRPRKKKLTSRKELVAAVFPLNPSGNFVLKGNLDDGNRTVRLRQRIDALTTATAQADLVARLDAFVDQLGAGPAHVDDRDGAVWSRRHERDRTRVSERVVRRRREAVALERSGRVE